MMEGTAGSTSAPTEPRGADKSGQSTTGVSAYSGQLTFINARDFAGFKSPTAQRAVRLHVQQQYLGKRPKSKASNNAISPTHRHDTLLSPHRNAKVEQVSGSRKLQKLVSPGNDMQWIHPNPSSPVRVPVMDFSNLCSLSNVSLSPLLSRGKSENTEDGYDVSSANGSDRDAFQWRSRPVSPISILEEGNSDPFSVYAIKITPIVSSLIQFHKEFVIPSLFGTTSWRRALAVPGAMREWSLSTEALQDSCSALATLTYHASMRAAVAPDAELSRQLFQFRGKTMSLLRSRLTSEEALREPETKWQISRLLTGDTIIFNPTSAKAHISMLQVILRSEFEQGFVDLPALERALFCDVHHAITTMRKPIFDVNGWVFDALKQTEDSFINAVPTALVPSLPESFKDFDESIGTGELRSIFLLRRESLFYWMNPPLTKEKHDTLILTYHAWLVGRGSMIHGRMLQYYLTIRKHGGPHSSAYVESQIYLCLATLCWSRCLIADFVMNGKRLFDTNDVLLGRLRTELLRSSAKPGNPEGPCKYQNARLWALYVGAYLEQRNALLPSPTDTRGANKRSNPSQGWFNARFAAQAQTMGLLSWLQIQPVLEKFLFLDRLQPHPSTWFVETMAHLLDDDPQASVPASH